MREKFTSMLAAFINEDNRERMLALSISLKDLISEIRFENADATFDSMVKAHLLGDIKLHIENHNSDTAGLLRYHFELLPLIKD